MKLPVTKLHITLGGIALMLAVLFSACETEVIDTSTPDAKLLSMKIVAKSGEIVMSGTSIPMPISNMRWVDENHDLFGEDVKTMSFKRDEDFVNDVYFEPTVSSGAKVKWGIASRTVRPDRFMDTRAPVPEFDEGNFFYFMVTSQDNEVTNYYRFVTYKSSPVKEIFGITVAGREGDMKLVSPAPTWDGDALTVGTLHVTNAEAARTVINAVLQSESSTLRYAVTPNSPLTEPVFGNSNILRFNDGERLYVEVTAENTLDRNIYCFRVYVGRIAAVKTLTFIGKDQSGADINLEALGKGTAKNEWTDNTGAGSFDSPHQPEGGFTFAVELEEADGTWQYAKMSGLSNSQPAWTDPPGGKNGKPVVRFEHGEYLAIKVNPPNLAAVAPYYYYKVKMGNLAAEFTKQPKSHVYNLNQGALPLEFALDRDVPNGTTYQWYEANSWYGGYGFDADGRIGEKRPPVLTAEAGWGDGHKGTINGIAYDVGAWYVKELDEKDNVSLHNGGNEHYRLPNPGRPIPQNEGGTSPTYIPKTDSSRRPFITGFSNQSHYYWVVVTVPTATGSLKATSARAVIVTEWGEQYHNGQPTGTKVDKKHHIIDLHAYETGEPGLQEPPRNATPFKAGNHGDSYWIPVTFPEGFDIMEYSVFTAQALFFLADGREWIQNWTQGDIGFGRWERDDNGKLTGQKEEIVLWYNLTNDNATRGLASSGNEPQGGGLTVIPDFIVVKPAGTKPINKMPPFMADTPANYDSVGRLKPDPSDKDAQGWFTPYIELCELRFEGPAR